MAPRARVAALLGGMLAAGLLFAAARPLDAVASPGQLGPGFWPRLVLIGLALACALKLVTDRRGAPGAGSAARSTEGPAPAVSIARLGSTIASILAYVLAAPLIGFPLATAGFIVLFMLLAGTRRAPVIAATAGVGTVVLLYTFVKLVYLPFPKGAGAFERVTLVLYRALGIF